MAKKIMAVLLIIMLGTMLSIFQSCGGGQSADEPSLSGSVDANSYLPLTAGIKTTFADGPVSSTSKLSVENIVLKVLDGGVVNVTGRTTNSETGEIIDIEENLTFIENGNEILLTQYTLEYSKSDGTHFQNQRVYDPPLIFLADKTTLDDVSYKTEHLTVNYTGEPEEAVYHNVVGEYVFYVAGYENITAEFFYRKADATMTIAGVEYESYSGSFQYDMMATAVWYPVNGLINGEFALVKGVGFVSIAGQNAISTNAIE